MVRFSTTDLVCWSTGRDSIDAWSLDFIGLVDRMSAGYLGVLQWIMLSCRPVESIFIALEGHTVFPLHRT